MKKTMVLALVVILLFGGAIAIDHESQKTVNVPVEQELVAEGAGYTVEFLPSGPV